MPFTGYYFKGFRFFRYRLLLRLTNSSGVNALGNLSSGFVSSLPCIGKGNFGICAQRKQFFLAAKTVAEPPPFVDSICSANLLK